MAAMSARAWLLLLTLSLVWGSTFVFADRALVELPAILVAWGRVAFGALFLVLMLRLAGEAWPRGWPRWRRYLAMGFLNNALPFTLIFAGQVELGAAAAAILNATTPTFTVLLAHVTTADERLTGGKAVGATLGFLGVALLIGLKQLSGLGTAIGPALLVLAGALSYALAGLYGRRFRGEPPLVTATGQVLSSTLLLAPVALLWAQPWRLPLPSAETWLCLLALGLLCTAFAYRLYFRILALAGATNLLLVTLLLPPAAMALQVLFLGKAVGWPELAGFAVIALGLAAIDGRALRLLDSARCQTG
jgi:drug/metabolite transporter (DMT)-like permease